MTFRAPLCINVGFEVVTVVNKSYCFVWALWNRTAAV